MQRIRRLIQASPIVMLLIIAIFIAPSVIIVIRAGEVGVRSTFGNVNEQVFEPGLRFKSPFTNIIRLSTRLQEYTMSQTTGEGVVTGDDSIQALASDGASIWLDVTVFYKLKGESAPDVYKELGLDFDEKIIRPEIRSKIREVVSRYAVNEVYSTKRSEIQSIVLEELMVSLDRRGIIVEEVLLRRVNLSSQLFDSIERKLTAQQKAEQKDFEIEEARKEAERKKVEAEGQREAQRIINESLSDKYLYFQYIQSLENHEGTIYIPTEGGLPLFKNVNE